MKSREFPGRPVVSTLTAKGLGSVPGWGLKIPQAFFIVVYTHNKIYHLNHFKLTIR